MQSFVSQPLSVLIRGTASPLLQATFQIHSHKRAEVNQMVAVGDGVWLSLKYDSTLRLFHATNFTHMQDLDIAPSIRRVLGEEYTVLSPYFGTLKAARPSPVLVLLATNARAKLLCMRVVQISFPVQ